MSPIFRSPATICFESHCHTLEAMRIFSEFYPRGVGEYDCLSYRASTEIMRVKLVYLVHYAANFGMQFLCSDLDDIAIIDRSPACVSLTKSAQSHWCVQ